jgi:hypothetical protein
MSREQRAVEDLAAVLDELGKRNGRFGCRERWFWFDVIIKLSEHLTEPIFPHSPFPTPFLGNYFY